MIDFDNPTIAACRPTKRPNLAGALSYLLSQFGNELRELSRIIVFVKFVQFVAENVGLKNKQNPILGGVAHKQPILAHLKSDPIVRQPFEQPIPFSLFRQLNYKMA